MPQAASIVAANYMYTQAPRDGTAIGALTRNLVNQALFGHPNLVADPRKMIWLGGTSFPGRICVVGEKAPVKKAADIFTKELIVRQRRRGELDQHPADCFQSSARREIQADRRLSRHARLVLAIERDEVQGVCASYGQFRPVRRPFRRAS